MYLLHSTNIKSLKNILKDGYMKSASLLLKEGYPLKSGEGFGNIYNKNKFIYFSCTDKLFDNIHGSVIIYFNSDLLYKIPFYVSTVQTPSPDDLSEWIDGANRKGYKRKYNRYYKKYNNVLKKLYHRSKKVLPKGKAYQFFQQIAISNKINLNKLIAIKFNIKPSLRLLNYINKNYPNLIIKY
jgi:hypothetical protein